MSRDIDQIRLAWRSYSPLPAVNPAAASFHRDLGVALDEIETYIQESKDLREQVAALESREVCNAAGITNIDQANKFLDRMEERLTLLESQS